MEHRIGPEAGLTLLGYNKNWYPNIIFYAGILCITMTNFWKIFQWLWMITNNEFSNAKSFYNDRKGLKKFQCSFCDPWNIGFIVKNFCQLLLIPWKKLNGSSASFFISLQVFEKFDHLFFYTFSKTKLTISF